MAIFAIRNKGKGKCNNPTQYNIFNNLIFTHYGKR